MLADILPDLLRGRRPERARCGPATSSAIVGAGPDRPRRRSWRAPVQPGDVVAIDLADARLEAAKSFGADVVVNNRREDAVAVVKQLTGGLGADVAIEAVGMPATFELAVDLARPGGHVANIGVHGARRRHCTSKGSGPKT